MTIIVSIKTNKTMAITEAITTTLLLSAFAEGVISGVTVAADRSAGLEGLDVGSTLGLVLVGSVIDLEKLEGLGIGLEAGAVINNHITAITTSQSK